MSWRLFTKKDFRWHKFIKNLREKPNSSYWIKINRTWFVILNVTVIYICYQFDLDLLLKNVQSNKWSFFIFSCGRLQDYWQIFSLETLWFLHHLKYNLTMILNVILDLNDLMFFCIWRGYFIVWHETKVVSVSTLQKLHHLIEMLPVVLMRNKR